MKISQGNTKLGKIPNISLPPVITCPNSSECRKDCYAVKSWKQYRNVRTAWTANLTEYLTEPVRYFDTISEYCTSTKSTHFRWQVSGDIIDQEYLIGMIKVAIENPKTEFLAFTKHYDILPRIESIPANLRLVASAWPGMDLPAHVREYPIAWLSTDNRRELRQRVAYQCEGKCDSCLECFSTSRDVVFELH